MNAADWQSLLAAGRRAVAAGEAALALDTLQRAAQLAPAQRDVRYWMANALRLAGRLRDAEAGYRALLRAHPGDSETAFALAFLLREEGRPQQLAEVLLALARSPAADLVLLLKIAGFLRDSNRFEEAIEVLRSAIALRPDDATLHFRLARMLQATGRFGDALAEVRIALDRDPGLGGAWISLAALQRFADADDVDFRRLRAAAERPAGVEAEMCIAFALAKACDDIGAWGLAWQHLGRGNRLRHAAQPWDRPAWNRQLDALLEAPLRIGAAPAAPTRHPVYLVGMLRSGTTLLEELLDRHPRVTARGELNFLAHQARASRGSDAADLLWSHLRLDGRADDWYVDKNPLNFRFLGFLAETLPEARIVHVTRDGRDTCLSCHFQLFQHPDAGFTTDLDDLLDYYRGYRRLMRRWCAELGERVLSVAYEDLVNDPRTTLHHVLAHVGLDWDEALEAEPASGRAIRTASAWQARQPIHPGSIGRWRHYREFAPDFFDAVHAADGA